MYPGLIEVSRKPLKDSHQLCMISNYLE